VFNEVRSPPNRFQGLVSDATLNRFDRQLSDSSDSSDDDDDVEPMDVQAEATEQAQPIPAKTPSKKRHNSTPKATPAAKRKLTLKTRKETPTSSTASNITKQQPTGTGEPTTDSTAANAATITVATIEITADIDSPSTLPAAEPDNARQNSSAGPSNPAAAAVDVSSPTPAVPTSQPVPEPAADRIPEPDPDLPINHVYNFNQQILNDDRQIVIIADENACAWPLSIKHHSNIDVIRLPEVGLQDIPQILESQIELFSDKSAIVLAVGYNNVREDHSNRRRFESAISNLTKVRYDERVYFAAMTEFENATRTEGAAITAINKAAKAALGNDRYIRTSPAIAQDFGIRDISYGPVTGKSYFDSVADFFSNLLPLYNPS